MVLDYYNLREQPFGVTPDPRYLYGSDTHVEAVASLLYGIEAGRGFVALIAQPGMGKTTLLFHALNRLSDRTRMVFLFQTICTPADLLRAVLADLGIADAHGSLMELQAKLNAALMKQFNCGKPVVILIDEAQNLDDSVLELVRMLSNFETQREKLVQIILCGQPQLADKLASPELVQLRQRISIIARLNPFSPKETALYINHRMRMAGCSANMPLFTAAALALIAQRSGGIPRNINNLCFNALSIGCALHRKTIDCDIIREVIADLDLDPWCKRMPPVVPTEQNDAREFPISREAPIFSSAAREPGWLMGRFPKLAVACAIPVVLAIALLHSYPWLAAKAAIWVDRGAPPLVSQVQSSSSVEQKPQPAVGPSTVRVVSGQSLTSICVENFGTCNPERMQEIHKLNPWLNNLDRIESGQKIRLPDAHELSGATQQVAQQSANAPVAEGGTR